MFEREGGQMCVCIYREEESWFVRGIIVIIFVTEYYIMV